MKEQMIKILLDETSGESDRDDAAGWLADYSDDATLDALYVVASRNSDNYFVQMKVGMSIGEILLRRNNFLFDKRYLIGLSKIAYKEASDCIRAVHPEWLDF